jgi:hypothetical protein
MRPARTGQPSSAAFLSRIVLIVSALMLSGCDEAPPEQPTVRFWETPVGAAERFIRVHGAFDLLLMEDYERYATDVINNKPIYASHFTRVNKYKERTFRPSYIFSQSLPGAYLSEQDKTYLDRLEEMLGKERQEIFKQSRDKLHSLQEAKAPDDTSMYPSSLLGDFRTMPVLVSGIERETAATLKSFADLLRRAMEAKSIDASVISALFRRPPGYAEVYEKNAKAIIGTAFEAAEDYIRRLPEPRRQPQYASENLRSFLGTEAAYGLEGKASIMLMRKGIYAALGDAGLEKFHRALREALSEVAPPSS